MRGVDRSVRSWRNPSVALQPQPDVMPAALRLRVILERGTAVEEPPVVDEEHIARLQVKLNAQLRHAQHRVERVKRSSLLGAQRFAGLLVPGFDPVAKVAAHEPVAMIKD